MTTKKLTKLLALYLPYILLGLVATNFGEAWRLAEGKELGDKIMSMMGAVPLAFASPLPSLHPLDLLVGLCCGAGLRLAVYLRGKNAKKYRHGMEYGSARWGTPKDIEPFMAPKFSDNIILTKTERLMMSNRPPDPKNARNKNVLVVGGSGSGKTRFWLKPNLLQMHSSYVVTDPKSTILLECGNAMLKNGYKVRILNTMRILSIIIFVIVYGRMIEIYCMVSLAPIPMATWGNHEQSHMGQNYLKCLFALGFQGFLILICVAIYAVLIQSVAISGDAINSIWSIVGYTVLLCFSLFKTSSVTKSVLGAH